MDEWKQMKFTRLSDDPGLAEFQRKIRDYLLELNEKRDSLSKLSLELQELKMEKHDLEHSLNKANRELSEVRIQADLAIKSARKGETERLNVRETLARQTVQIEIMTRERDMLQEQLRLKEVDNAKLQQLLERSEQQIKTHASYQETCQVKHVRDHTSLESLAKELVVLENDQSKLKRMHVAIVSISQRVKLHVCQQREVLQDCISERNALKEKVNSLTGKYSKEKKMLGMVLAVHESMKVRNKEMEVDNVKIQTALELSLTSLSKSQEIQRVLEDKIKYG
ncbi:hypothetical protein AAG570_001449 [Ranatra chinensis]|uniref:Uncharacterized protein n=1 Tax=Ranatra chinensis TaxID=642074 RepID=A0ABD0Y8J0_9HEMI